MTVPDAELLARIAKGDRAAFEALYRRWASYVHGVAIVGTRSGELAAEVTQEVFVRVWRYARAFDAERGRVESWLFAITRNRIRDRVRLAQRTTAVEQELAPEFPDPRDRRPEHAYAGDEMRVSVREALDILPAAQRAAIELCFFEGLTHREAAARLGVALGTLKGRVRLAMDKLRGRLEEDES